MPEQINTDKVRWKAKWDVAKEIETSLMQSEVEWETIKSTVESDYLQQYAEDRLEIVREWRQEARKKAIRAEAHVLKIRLLEVDSEETREEIRTKLGNIRKRLL